MKLLDYIINVFVMVYDFCTMRYPTRKLRQRGPKPKLSDSEVITLEIVGEYLGFDTDEGIYKYFSRHWHFLFPNMPYRSNFVRQCANLWAVKQLFFESLSRPQDHYLLIADSMPIEVCKFVRARMYKQFKQTATYSKWFGQTFFGYSLHSKINDVVMIRHFIVSTARESDVRLAESLIGDDFGG